MVTSLVIRAVCLVLLGMGVDESGEAASENDIAISIKGSKSTSSSYYGSHANESAFLQLLGLGII